MRSLLGLFVLVAFGAWALYKLTGWVIGKLTQLGRQREPLLRCTECYAAVKHGDMPGHWAWHDTLDREIQEVLSK